MSYLNDAIWNIKECFPDLRYEVVYDDILTALAKAVLAKLEKRADVDAFLQVVRD